MEIILTLLWFLIGFIISFVYLRWKTIILLGNDNFYIILDLILALLSMIMGPLCIMMVLLDLKYTKNKINAKKLGEV